MTIFVGSTNPVKINAVTIAASETYPEAVIEGFETASGINEQPLSDEETRQGARNRATAASKKGLEKNPHLDPTAVLGVGLEGGVFVDKDQIMWSTVWIVVTDHTGIFYESNGARFPVPPIIAEIIKNGGEMGPVVSQLVGETNVRQKQGMIGVITNGFIDRTEEYSGIAKMALGLWHGRNWQDQLK
jgi:inosine/xanthosine triphosphatase